MQSASSEGSSCLPDNSLSRPLEQYPHRKYRLLTYPCSTKYVPKDLAAQFPCSMADWKTFLGIKEALHYIEFKVKKEVAIINNDIKEQIRWDDRNNVPYPT